MSQEDLAQDREAQDWEINNRPRKAPPEFKPEDSGYGPEFCKDDACEAPMPTERRALGKNLCVGCQELLERSRLRR